jgi:hypothetical protein
MRWDQSPECRALIDQQHAALLRLKEEQARHPEWQEQEIRVNEHWHAQNLNLLEQCVAYARAREHYYEFLATLRYYHMQESQRLQERMEIMKRYNIERLPHQHKAREKTLNAELIALLKF